MTFPFSSLQEKKKADSDLAECERKIDDYSNSPLGLTKKRLGGLSPHHGKRKEVTTCTKGKEGV